MLPQDPMILLSYLNTKLRDFYPTLDAYATTSRSTWARSAGGWPPSTAGTARSGINLSPVERTNGGRGSIRGPRFFPPQRNDIPLPVCYTRVKSAEKEDIA